MFGISFSDSTSHIHSPVSMYVCLWIVEAQIYMKLLLQWLLSTAEMCAPTTLVESGNAVAER